jgi:hypothetical protein
MLGIILTVLAVFFVVCVAFYFSDNAGARAQGTEALFMGRTTKGKDHPLSPSRK